MTDLTAISDEDLIAEQLRRGLHMRHGMFAWMSSDQLAYHARFNAVCQLSADWNNRPSHFDLPLVRELRGLIERVADEPASAAPTHSLNTSMYGAEDRLAEVARAA